MNPIPNQAVSEALLTEHQVAALLNVSVATMRRRRLRRQPPDWVKLGASVRYKRTSVEDFIESGHQTPGGNLNAKNPMAATIGRGEHSEAQ